MIFARFLREFYYKSALLIIKVNSMSSVIMTVIHHSDIFNKKYLNPAVPWRDYSSYIYYDDNATSMRSFVFKPGYIKRMQFNWLSYAPTQLISLSRSILIALISHEEGSFNHHQQHIHKFMKFLIAKVNQIAER